MNKLRTNKNEFCLGEKLVDEKSNEITVIPELLDVLNVKGHIQLHFRRNILTKKTVIVIITFAFSGIV